MPAKFRGNAAGYGTFSAGLRSPATVVDFMPLFEEIRTAVAGVVRAVGRNALQVAQARVPVRHAFIGGHRTFRTMGVEEMKAEFNQYIRAFPTNAEGKAWTTEQLMAQRLSQKVTVSANRANRWAGVDRETGLTGEQMRQLRMSGQPGRASWSFVHPVARSLLSGPGMYEYMHLWRKNSALSTGENPVARSPLVAGKIGSRREMPIAHLGGNLLKSLHVVDAVTDHLVMTDLIAGGERAPYAKYQEFGTRHNPAHPFLRPALKQVETTYVNRMVNGINLVARRRPM